jgi:hypothetical protein
VVRAAIGEGDDVVEHTVVKWRLGARNAAASTISLVDVTPESGFDSGARWAFPIRFQSSRLRLGSRAFRRMLEGVLRMTTSPNRSRTASARGRNFSGTPVANARWRKSGWDCGPTISNFDHSRTAHRATAGFALARF